MCSDTNRKWRLILSPAASGAWNMALDEALLDSAIAGTTPPTLRLYAWSPPCLSIGYAQPIEQVNRDRLKAFGWDLVRRPTGGRAILHTDELTYSILLPAKDINTDGSVLSTYKYLSAGLIAALKLLGLTVNVQPEQQLTEEQRKDPVCFEVPSSYEILIEGRKLIGSAQVRRRGAILQHGTLPLEGDITRICQILSYRSSAARDQAIQRLRSRATTLAEISPQKISWDRAAEAMIEGFSQTFGISLERQDPTAQELSTARRLQGEQYQRDHWNARQ
jgi:lipoate-protein ligase A